MKIKLLGLVLFFSVTIFAQNVELANSYFRKGEYEKALEQYNKSMFLYQMQDWGGLFVYQLDYANKLLDGYDERFCWEHIFKEIGVTYTNKKHFECIGKSYNGHPRFKYAYVQLGWERRSVISDMIFN